MYYFCPVEIYNFMPRSAKYHPRYDIVASYSDGDYLLSFRSSFDDACALFNEIVSFRLRGYMTFRSVRLCVPSTKRVLCEYKDYRYLEQSKPFEKLYPYGIEKN